MAPSSPTPNEPFPPPVDTAAAPRTPPADTSSPVSSQNKSASSPTIGNRLRRVSQSFGTSDIPEGFSAATGGIASTIFSRQAAPKSASTTASSNDTSQPNAGLQTVLSSGAKSTKENKATAPFANGYHFPPAHSAGHSTKLGLIAFWKYFTTPVGFIVTIYGLNIVAWGGMLFLLLCNACKCPSFCLIRHKANMLEAPAMCYPTCNDINSPRRKWIEWDSQILNALFCVTGFGLAPWRFRDLYYLLQYRIGKKEEALRRLAGIHQGWLRLPGSENLPVGLGPHNVTGHLGHAEMSSVPYPESKTPNAPLTGMRAPATKLWKLDAVIWLMVWNTFFQICLAAFMWAMNRYERPSWSTGLFVALACIVAAVGGIIMFLEGKAVKSVEGVPVTAEDQARLDADREQGILHFNNIKDKDLEAEKAKKEKKEKTTGVKA